MWGCANAIRTKSISKNCLNKIPSFGSNLRKPPPVLAVFLLAHAVSTPLIVRDGYLARATDADGDGPGRSSPTRAMECVIRPEILLALITLLVYRITLFSFWPSPQSGFSKQNSGGVATLFPNCCLFVKSKRAQLVPSRNQTCGLVCMPPVGVDERTARRGACGLPSGNRVSTWSACEKSNEFSCFEETSRVS